MPPPDSSDPTTVDPGKCNTAEAQDKYFKIAVMNMIKDHKEDMIKYINAICENTNSGMQ